MKGGDNHLIRKIGSVLFRNSFLNDGQLAHRNRVNIEYWNRKLNVGDQLSVPIVEWMLAKKGISVDKRVKGTRHLLGLGSILGSGHFDATVWGSGVNTPIATYRTGRWRKRVKLAVKAVRGPLTKEVLESFGYDCSGCVFGDPGILMPLIYMPEAQEKQYQVSIICHFKTIDRIKQKYPNYHYIRVDTDAYRSFIDEIVASERIISSSLHGIILAEAYGVPAVFLNEDGLMDREILKYYDYYYSTGRRNVVCATTLEEALELSPMKLPELGRMQSALMESFPYELWDC